VVVDFSCISSTVNGQPTLEKRLLLSVALNDYPGDLFPVVFRPRPRGADRAPGWNGSLGRRVQQVDVQGISAGRGTNVSMPISRASGYAGLLSRPLVDDLVGSPVPHLNGEDSHRRGAASLSILPAALC
jgi:hypothetical protein